MDITLQEIAEIVNETKGRNYFSNQLESALKPLFTKLKGIEKNKEEISLMNLFSLDSTKSAKFKNQYENALKGFIEGFEQKVKEFKGLNVMEVVTGNSIKTTKNDNGSTSSKLVPLPKSSPKDRSVGFEKILNGLRKDKFDTEESNQMLEVGIVHVSDQVIDRLGGLKPVINNTTLTTSESNSNNSSNNQKGFGSLLGNIIKTISITALAVGLIGGGVTLALKGLVEGGPTKGLFKVMGDILLGVGAQIFKTFTDRISNFIKPIGDMLGMNATKAVGKAGGGGIFGFLGKLFKPLASIGKMAGKGLKLVFKAIPFLGSIISLAFAVSRFKEGDIMGGLLELTSALLGLTPFPGLALIPDVVLMFRDLTMSKEKKESQGGSFLIGLRNWFVTLPVIRNFISLFKGLSLIFTGKGPNDVDKGLLHLKDASFVLWICPPLKWMLSVIEMIYDPSGFFKGAKNVVKSAGNGLYWIWEKLSNMFIAVLDWIGNIFTNIWESDAIKKIRLNVNIGLLHIKNGLSKALNWYISIPQAIVQKLTDVVGSTLDWAYEFTGIESLKKAKLGLNSLNKQFQGFGIDTDSIETEIDNKRREIEDINKRREDRQNEHDAEKAMEAEKRKEDYDNARHNELKDSIEASGLAQVQATQNSGSLISSAISAQNNGRGSTTNIFSNQLSKQSEEVRSKIMKHVWNK